METAIIAKLDTFFTQFKQQTFKEKEIIIRAEEEPTGILYIQEGFIKTYALDKKGNEIIVNIYKPNAFLPMSWALNNTPNNYFYESMTNVVVWKAPKDETVTFLKRENEVMYDLLRRVLIGADGLLTRMTYLLSGNAYLRLVSELLISAKRFGNKEPITLRVTEQQLANQTGLTRETVSREMKLLKQKNLIQVQRSMIILIDLKKLEEELGNY